MNVPRPGAYKLAPRSRGGESKNAVPSKKPNRCCGADTDMSERARAYSKVHSKIDRAASRERSLISPSAMLNVYLNAKKGGPSSGSSSSGRSISGSDMSYDFARSRPSFFMLAYAFQY